MDRLKPRVSQGYSCLVEELSIRSIKKIHGHEVHTTETPCANCEKRLHQYDNVWVLRNKRRELLRIFCSVLCQRQWSLDRAVKKTKEWRRELKEREQM